MDNGQSQTAAVRLRREEWIEHPVADLGRNAWAGVGDAKRDRVAVEGQPKGERLEAAVRDFDLHFALRRGGLHRVERKIEHSAMQEILVAVDLQRLTVGRYAGDA